MYWEDITPKTELHNTIEQLRAKNTELEIVLKGKTERIRQLEQINILLNQRLSALGAQC